MFTCKEYYGTVYIDIIWYLVQHLVYIILKHFKLRKMTEQLEYTYI